MTSRSAQQRPSSRPNIFAKIVDLYNRSQGVGKGGGRGTLDTTGFFSRVVGSLFWLKTEQGLDRNQKSHRKSLWHPGYERGEEHLNISLPFPLNWQLLLLLWFCNERWSLLSSSSSSLYRSHQLKKKKTWRSLYPRNPLENEMGYSQPYSQSSRCLYK